MLGAESKGSFKARTSIGGVRRAAALALLVACCALLTACPPEGGDLVPLAQGEGGREEKFVLEFKINSDDGRSGVPRNLLGQTMTLRLPVEIDSAKPSADSAGASRVDFVFGFKYAEYRRAR